ncbi:glycine cleavage system protein GcvH [Leptospira ilyithenensis]|uniref:Glycine cleavage system H protein n=1 Tax=Leptospira ilyithenensis TaxID=2484901 RepID=A0A4R9LPS7_9LEPT|nr:glycine cleavage system protein GcvH [Leptospira ilyithenensis]TGN09839.1 glycine cleavage system protein GcvH [Leptospira ilyithenensis]
MAVTEAKDGYYYTEKHEWVKVEGDVALVGITDFAQNALGDIVFIDLPKVGKKINQKDSLGTIESVKAAEDLYAPVSGEVSETNASLSATPGNVNTAPFDSWMVKLKGIKPEELKGLLSASQYKEYVSKLD